MKKQHTTKEIHYTGFKKLEKAPMSSHWFRVGAKDEWVAYQSNMGHLYLQHKCEDGSSIWFRKIYK